MPLEPGARGAGARDRPACKPGSVRTAGRPCRAGDHPSRPTVAGGLERPTRVLGRAALGRTLSGLAPDGVYRAAPVTRRAGGLLHHLFTLTRSRRAVYFLWHCPAGFPEWALPTIQLCGARTFLETRLSMRRAVTRPACPASILPRRARPPIHAGSNGLTGPTARNTQYRWECCPPEYGRWFLHPPGSCAYHTLRRCHVRSARRRFDHRPARCAASHIA